MNSSSNPLVACPVCGTQSRIFRDKDTDRAFCPVCHFPVESNGVIPLDDITIAKFLKMVKKPVMVLFWAPWEKESVQMLTLLSSEVPKQPLKALVAATNIAENPESRRHFGIEILPTFLMFAFGREINRVIGSVKSFDIIRLADCDCM